MSLPIGESTRESLVMRGAEALRRRQVRRGERVDSVSLRYSSVEREFVILRDTQGVEVARFKLRREGDRLTLLFVDPLSRK